MLSKYFKTIGLEDHQYINLVKALTPLPCFYCKTLEDLLLYSLLMSPTHHYLTAPFSELLLLLAEIYTQHILNKQMTELIREQVSDLGANQEDRDSLRIRKSPTDALQKAIHLSPLDIGQSEKRAENCPRFYLHVATT